MPGILANDVDYALTFHYLALVTNLLNRRSDLHGSNSGLLVSVDYSSTAEVIW